ncbi:hypothetical protein HJC23_006334 [Cyclotella cryptica]|uniref:GDT1 family protein n=1 Tax=Cyclotella cryptica TaxID=29204 RepID=A0ABD3Q3T5_9STRA|eukprot:CCRYP_008723-RA/>CCRYP_008723-RA protein AED:0.32 eAED:0.32 QI:351/1/1/1/1/1/2/502/338
MRHFALLSFVGCVLRIVTGFSPTPLSTERVRRSIISAKPPSAFNIEHDSNQNAHLSATFKRHHVNSSAKSAPHRNKMAIAASSTAIIAIAALGLPLVSNAMITLSDISSITGGASASAASWLDSLTDSGFYQAFSLVFLSEIGDKTFFVAALLAAKLSRFISFVGSLGALAVMSIISVVIGQVFHAVPAGIANGVPLDDVAAVIAFTYFGVKVLSEAFESEDGKSAMDEEFEEAEETVEGNEKFSKGSNVGAQIASIFALVFAAEFGDRSFLATIALSAAQNPVSVAAGAIAAHGIATGIAVLGGAYISKYVSEKVIGYIGGALFLIFAATTAVGIFH